MCGGASSGYKPGIEPSTGPLVEDNRPPLGLRLLCVWFVVRFGLDAWILAETWGTAAMSPPKLGIAILLLPLAVLCWRQYLWSICLAGMVCLFWLGFAAARTLGLMMQGAEPGSPYPWANWVAVPALFYLLHYAQRFTQPTMAAKDPPTDRDPHQG